MPDPRINLPQVCVSAKAEVGRVLKHHRNSRSCTRPKSNAKHANSVEEAMAKHMRSHLTAILFAIAVMGVHATVSTDFQSVK